MGDARNIDVLLRAYGEYRSGLINLFHSLDISTCYAGDPRLLFAGLLVAEIVDGIALPPPSELHLCAFTTVVRPDGRDIRALCISDQLGFDSGGFVENGDRNEFDELAIVAFIHASPVAVHFIPAERVNSVGATLGAPRLPGRGLCITIGTHSNLVLEPVAAAAQGVTTFDLVARSA